MNALTHPLRVSHEAVSTDSDSRSEDLRYKNRFNSLGIPVDNLTREDAVARVMSLIEEFHVDGRARLVATLNVDFLVNSLGYRFNSPRHPELLDVLRDADLVTADGFPIVLLSAISGCPIKERVTGADLVPALACAAAKSGKSIYLLGGESDSAQQAAKKLQSDFPGLMIAGTESPMVFTEGRQLESWQEGDRAIVDKINASKADILLLAFGNPKQELWWSRNRKRLNVPVSIGIGGTFSFITGRVKRAPLWMQRNNLEWLFRISQDPRRLFKRYAIGMVKFGFLSLPIIQHRLIRKLQTVFSRQDVKQPISPQWKVHWASKDDALKTLRLPRQISRDYVEKLVASIHQDRSLSQKNYNYLLDFSCVDYLAISANEAFCELSRLFDSGRVQGLMIGMPKRLKRWLKDSRIMDLAVSSTLRMDQLEGCLLSSCSGTDFLQKSYALDTASLNYFRGALTGHHLENSGFEAGIMDAGKHRRVILDLRMVERIDSSALAIFLRLHRAADLGQIRSFALSGLTFKTKQMIQILGLSGVFQLMDDKEFYDALFAD